MMVRLLRALRVRLRPHPPTFMQIPAHDDDGQCMWMEARHAPTPDEYAWATHPSKVMRSAYAIHAVTLARREAERSGYTAGWGE